LSSQAQSTVNIKDYSGTLTSYTLTDIHKLTFGSVDFTITQNGGATNTYSFTNVRYVNFTGSTTGVQNSNTFPGVFSVYPNPAIDELQLLYTCDVDTEVDLEVKDLQGRIVKNEKQNASAGDNYSSIFISDLPTGFYICTVRTENKQQSVKFVKN